MGGSGFSREKFNARETILSSDFNRLEALANRDGQNLLADAATDNAGLPITGLSGPCTLTGITGQFNMALSAAQALCYNPSDSSLTADDSPYEVARWAAQNLLFANPPGANARIDLVVVTPAMVDADSQSRNILVDPVARTIAPQNVFKTTNPQATVAIVAGTPGVTPAPPAVPAGAFALFEVYVPSGATDSTGFSVVPRMFRRAPFPWSTISGIVSGFHPLWDLTVTPGATDSTITFNALESCRIVIDGELIETLGLVFLSGAVFSDAGSNNPFAVAAAAHWHKPYYLYAVGGRHAPQLCGLNNSPIAIVESLVPPLPSTGNPSANITTPRGTTTQKGAVYIGLGFVCANTQKRLPCIMDKQFTRVSEVSPLGPINTLTHAAGSANFEAFDVNAPPVIPTVSDLLKVTVIPGTTVTAAVNVTCDKGDGTGPAPGFGPSVNAQVDQVAVTVAGPAEIGGSGEVSVNPASPKIWVATAAGSGTVGLCVVGFAHKVDRLRY